MLFILIVAGWLLPTCCSEISKGFLSSIALDTDTDNKGFPVVTEQPPTEDDSNAVIKLLLLKINRNLQTVMHDIDDIKTDMIDLHCDVNTIANDITGLKETAIMLEGRTNWIILKVANLNFGYHKLQNQLQGKCKPLIKVRLFCIKSNSPFIAYDHDDQDYFIYFL